MANPVLPFSFSLAIPFPLSDLIRTVKCRPRINAAFEKEAVDSLKKDARMLFLEMSAAPEERPILNKELLFDLDMRSLLYNYGCHTASVGISNKFCERCKIFDINAGCRHSNSRIINVIQLNEFGASGPLLINDLRQKLHCQVCGKAQKVNSFPSALVLSYPNGQGQVILDDMDLTELGGLGCPKVAYSCVTILKMDREGNCSSVVRNANDNWYKGWIAFQGDNAQVVQMQRTTLDCEDTVLAVYEKLS